MKHFLLFALILLGIYACEENGNLNQEEEEQELQKIFTTIKEMASDMVCEDEAKWTFTAYGSKPCGGPQGYIAYSKNINTTEFLSLIEQYTKAEHEFNKKWEIASDCAITPHPKSVKCKNDKVVLIY